MQTTGQIGKIATIAVVASLLLSTVALVWAQSSAPDFQIIERKTIQREMVWFNGREGDFEYKPFLKNKRVYVTLLDLMRHIGGNLLTGPPKNLTELERNKVLVRVLPGQHYVLLNGMKTDVERAPIKRGGAMYVPLRFYCNLFGISVEWNRIEQRAYVSFSTE